MGPMVSRGKARMKAKTVSSRCNVQECSGRDMLHLQVMLPTGNPDALFWEMKHSTYGTRRRRSDGHGFMDRVYTNGGNNLQGILECDPEIASRMATGDVACKA